MARFYPRFLFSNPRDTKSTGPFIVHSLYPKGIIQIDENYNLVSSLCWDTEIYPGDFEKIIPHAIKWAKGKKLNFKYSVSFKLPNPKDYM